MYEFSSAICLSAVTVFLLLQWGRPSRRLGLFVLLPVVLGLGVATMVLYTPVGPLVPVLHSYWLVIHVAAAITASGLFTVAPALAAVYLAVTGRGTGRVRSALRTVVPDPDNLDDLCFRLLAIAFPIWTFAVVAGAIWAESASLARSNSSRASGSVVASRRRPTSASRSWSCSGSERAASVSTSRQRRPKRAIRRTRSPAASRAAGASSPIAWIASR